MIDYAELGQESGKWVLTIGLAILGFYHGMRLRKKLMKKKKEEHKNDREI